EAAARSISHAAQFDRVPAAEKSNHRHCRLLRARRQRPRGRRAAEQRDERAAFWIELHAIPHDERGAAPQDTELQAISQRATGILQPVLVLPTLAGDRPLHVRYDERAD